MSVFSENLQKKIQHYLERYETRRSAILPILHEIQDECGWIQPQHVEALESEYDLAKAHVQEVATFYSMYRLEKSKDFCIYLCDNLVCCMMGAKEVKDKIRAFIQESGAKKQSSPFSLTTVPCLGVCDGAPAMLVNKDRYLNVHSGNVDSILKTYLEGKHHVGNS